jgi:dienelactone hydrolase
MFPEHDLKATLLRLLGIPELRCDIAPEYRGNIDLGDIVVEKWLITAEPGSRIPCNMYRPRRITESIPAIVMTCGHGGSKSVSHMNYVARTYALAGVACLVADPLGEEERHHEGGMGTRAHDTKEVAYRCEVAGRSVMGKFVFDAMRCIDFLETLDWVDTDRLGVAGNSLGGAVAGWMFALEPRLRMTIVSGWAFSDFLRSQHGKHCTRVPYHKLRSVCEWNEFLQLGSPSGAVLVMNGDADVVIDQDGSGVVWRDTVAHFTALDPTNERLQTWFCPGGGHRAYHGTKRALQFIHEQLGTPLMNADEIASLPELHYGTWCDSHDVGLEKLYGTELHYRGATLPDLGLEPIDRGVLAVLDDHEVGTADFTIDGWLKGWNNS